MRVFEVTTPDGRKVRHVAEDAEKAASRLIAGYVLSGEVLGSNEHQDGGYVVPLVPGQSVMASLLKYHGDELRAWLAAEGYKKR